MKSEIISLGCFDVDVGNESFEEQTSDNGKTASVTEIYCESQKEFENYLKDFLKWALNNKIATIIFTAGYRFRLPQWFFEQYKKLGITIKIVGKKYMWSSLNHLQLGRYAEYYVKMMFLMYGLDVYTPEIDDKGIDFIIVNKLGNIFKMQVKSVRKMNYVFVRKNKFPLSNDLFLVLVVFNDGKLPEIYLIPSIDWNNPNKLLVYRSYTGKKSKPEYGVNISSKNMQLLKQYEIQKQIYKLL